MDQPLPLGTNVPPYGKVAGVGFVGERYYWLIDKRDGVAMIPSDALLEHIRLNIERFDKMNGWRINARA